MQNIEHFDEIYAAFKTELEKLQESNNPQIISSQERMLWKLMIELRMTLPRLQNDVMKASRKRRNEIARGE